MHDSTFLARAVAVSKLSPESVGCGVVIVQDGKELAAEYNSQKTDGIAVYHAEIKAIIAANKRAHSRTLPGATAYCSCEPCAMCLTALSYAKIPRIVYYKKMSDFFPEDPQSQFDAAAYVRNLNFVPMLEQLNL
ncbi:MAG TPA: deaminase [Bacillota bacterium]|nr:deaminase [Bacillota bacterium]